MITLYTPEKAIRVTGGKILLLSEDLVRLPSSLQGKVFQGVLLLASIGIIDFIPMLVFLKN